MARFSQLMVTIVLACAMSACGGGSSGGVSSPTTVLVPNVVGQSQQAAETAIRGANLQTGSGSSLNSDSVAEGSVISQSPSGGASVSPGTTVSLVISLGPAATQDPPVITLSASQTTVSAGTDVVLTWSTQNASSCTATGSWSGVRPTSGTGTVTVEENATYGMQCSGDGGSVQESVSVTVTGPQAPVISYSIPSEWDVGVSIGEIGPTVSETVDFYSISPPLPIGLGFDTQTGVISGSARESSTSTQYVVRATNAGGEGEASFVLRIRSSQPAPTTFAITGFNDTPGPAYAWEGGNVALVTLSADLNPGSMQMILAGLDAGYDFYLEATGRAPSPNFEVNGKLAIYEVPETGCGAGALGCGFFGATGIEIAEPIFDHLYSSYRDRDEFDQVIFYELGRNFWFYGDKAEYKGADFRFTVTTGYAVLMRLGALNAAGLNGTFLGLQSFEDFESALLSLVDTYEADAAFTWENTLRAGQGVPNALGLGSTDLFASFVLRLAEIYGTEEAAYLGALWKAIDARPNAVTTQDAVDNFVLAASEAAGTNLISLFETDWRWPISDAAKQEAETRFGAP